MKKLQIAILLIFMTNLIFSQCEMKPMSKEVKLYVDEFLEVIEQNSLYKEELDIAVIKKLIETNANGAQKIPEVYAALRYGLRAVDKHSMFWSAEQIEEWKAPKKGKKLIGVSSKILVTKGQMFGKIAYLSMPGIGSGNPTELIYFADSLQNLIKSLDASNPIGWVLDLRNNDGGNCWPMLAGIGPLLGEGVCGYFTLEDVYQDWSYENGASMMQGRIQTQVSIQPLELKDQNPKVAVLVGPTTSSSGEVTTIAFRNRPNTKSFGQPTGGYSTTNSNFNMSDGSMLLLAISVYADRTKEKFGQEIIPDVIVEESGSEEDQTLEQAIEWLLEY